MPEERVRSTSEMTFLALNSGEKMFLRFGEFLKAVMIILLALSLGSLYPLFALIVLFVGYFYFPTEYSPYRPEEMFGGWMRALIGLYIALVLFTVLSQGTVSFLILLIFPALINVIGSLFTGAGASGGFAAVGTILISAFMGVIAVIMPAFFPKAKVFMTIGIIILGAFILGGLMPATFATKGYAAMFFIASAFFIAGPERKKLSEDEAVGIKKSAAYFNLYMIGDMVFSMFMFMAFADISQWAVGFGGGVGSGFLSGAGFIIFIIWIFSFLTGLLGGRAQRPYMGVLVLGMTMVLFAFSFTGTFGVALFGQFWAPMSQVITAVVAPMEQAFTAAQNQIYCIQLFATCPSCYSADWRCTGGAPPVQTGTVKVIELSDFEALNMVSGTNELDPKIPLIGTIQLTNDGDFTADGVTVEMMDLRIKDPSAMSIQNKVYEAVSCDYNGSGLAGQTCKDQCVFTSCTDAKVKDYRNCNWTEPVIPGDIKLISFKCGNISGEDIMNNWSFSDDCACRNVDKDGKVIKDQDKEVKCSDPCTGYDYKVYNITKDLQKYVTIPMRYYYNYSADVTMPVVVMNLTIFQQKLLSKEITIKEVESKYSGGPVAVGLWTQKQPLRSGETSYGRVFVSNTGSGKLSKESEIKVNLPAPGGLAITGIKFISDVNLNCIPDETHIYSFICNFEDVMLPNGDKNYRDFYQLFEFNYTIPDMQIQEKSALWHATLSYQYIVEKEITDMPIVGMVR